MKLHEFAQSVADAPSSDAFRDLSRRPPLNAVIECAHRAGAIDEAEYNALLHMDWEDDFALFVGPNDDRVKRRADVRKIPAGAFIAFIRVDRPRTHKEWGRRHLIHAMISLDHGKAVGIDPSQIGIGAAHAGWSIVDLDEGLNWLGDSPTNGYDLFNRFAVATQKSEPLRLRHRPPGRSSPSTAAPGSSRLAWGRPAPDASLRAAILQAAQSLRGLKVEPGQDNAHNQPAQHVFRVNFRFELDHESFEAFFNSPNELRGHYYADGPEGDAYMRDLLVGIADSIDWNQALATLGQQQLFGQPFPAQHQQITELVKASLVAGKIWFVEKRSVSTETDWFDGNNQRVPIEHSPNTRWLANRQSAAGNWQAFLADTQADKGLIDANAFAALKTKFDTLGLAHARKGAKYRYCLTPAQAVQHGLSLENMDVKGDWVRADGRPAGFTPDGKHFRGHQIKWFGFT